MHEQVVDDIPRAFVAALVEFRPRSIALSGGTTAQECYEAAATASVDWSTTTFWFGDERWVAVTDPESNEGMARKAWLDRVPVGAIESMVNAGADPDDAARTYEARLRATQPIDLVHLGLGPDGHTASLFPTEPTLTDPTLTDPTRWVVPAGDAAHPHPRLTLTFAAIAEVRRIVVTVAGAGKRDALAGVRAADPRLPASRLVSDPDFAAKTIWLVDRATAGA